jgi:hypothetical protein
MCQATIKCRLQPQHGITKWRDINWTTCHMNVCHNGRRQVCCTISYIQHIILVRQLGVKTFTGDVFCVVGKRYCTNVCLEATSCQTDKPVTSIDGMVHTNSMFIFPLICFSGTITALQLQKQH